MREYPVQRMIEVGVERPETAYQHRQFWCRQRQQLRFVYQKYIRLCGISRLCIVAEAIGNRLQCLK
jgi:hypothetical protein